MRLLVVFLALALVLAFVVGHRADVVADLAPPLVG